MGKYLSLETKKIIPIILLAKVGGYLSYSWISTATAFEREEGK